MKIDKLVVLAVILCSVVLIGELTAYGPNTHNYNADCTLDGNIVNVSVSSSGSDTYSVIFMDNGTFAPPVQLYIFSDERYDEFFDEARKTSNINRFDQHFAIDQITRSLRIRGLENIAICNEEKLLSSMTDDIGSGTPKGLLVISYALPQSIYSGEDGDLIFEWIKDGNSLYWMNSPIGMFYQDGSKLFEVTNSQELFFGKECINTDGNDLALYAIDNELTNALSLKWNRTIFGMDPTGIAGAVSFGFTQDGFVSTSMVPLGEGMVCVMGGRYDRNQCDDISQIISSGVSCYSDVLKVDTGSVRRGTVYVDFDVPGGTGSLYVFVSIGGIYTVYGRAFDVQ